MNDRPHLVLVVDSDRFVARSIADLLEQFGYETMTAGDVESAVAAVDNAVANCVSGDDGLGPVAVMIVDMSIAGRGGLDLIKTIRSGHADVVPIAITGFATVESAVRAIRAGAIDYLIKPLVDEELRIAVEKAVQQHALLAENSCLRRQLDRRYGLDNIIGADPRMLKIYEIIEAVASSKTTVLMCGESGTGKSILARAIHQNSARANDPFVELSCGSIPETLLESELFGHLRGAFTGAHVDKPGRFLAAHGGTIFLDEINSASPGMQLKLLRVLQERQFEPVGSHESIEVDVRVILASNQPLEELVAAGKFRQDLYYRINVVSITLPPLRERVGDIPHLVEHFVIEHGLEIGRQVTGVTDEAMAVLRAYAFPGNVRELENIIERAVVLTRSTRIDVNDLPPHVIENSTHALLPEHARPNPLWTDEATNGTSLRKAMEKPEKQIILAALEANDWNRQKTAEQLDINRTTLYKKIKQYDLEAYGRTA